MTADSPTEAVEAFEETMNAPEEDGEIWTRDFGIEIDLHPAQKIIEIRNLPSFNGRTDSYELKWDEVPGGYSFDILTTTDAGTDDVTGLESTIEHSSFAPMSAAALLHSYGSSRSHHEPDTPLSGEAAVQDFEVGDHSGVSLAFWSDDNGGQMLVCKPA